MTQRQIKLHRVLLQALTDVPEGYLLPEDIVRGETARRVVGGVTTMEFEEELRRADLARRIIGTTSDTGERRWKITDLGTLWLAEHP